MKNAKCTSVDRNGPGEIRKQELDQNILHLCHMKKKISSQIKDVYTGADRNGSG